MGYVKHFEQVVTLDKKDRIATINFVCPQNKNMMNEQFVDEFGSAMQEAANDKEVRVIVMRAEGDVFIGTGDLALMIAPVMMTSVATGRKIMHNIGDIVRMMYRCSKPIIAAVDGLAIGGGCGLTLSADIIIASDKASFNEVCFAQSSLPCDSGGLWSLQRLVGTMKAKYIALRPDIITAQEAFELGIVAKVVPSEKIYDEVYGLAAYIADLSPVGVNAIKQISNRMPEYSLDTYLQLEAEYIAHGAVSHDFKEYVASKKEGRNPEFIGE
ncbi:MAG: putative enoyl-CoA hydratase echA8 [Pelotomaculum sp. PtaB.Bin104]|nr:MAG: putative enoyl-CoA hydratase echA8 [Pelotomaculum sp. PtaB.Bin104]